MEDDLICGTPHAPPVCYRCAHYSFNVYTNPDGFRRCSAFPDGIPDAIFIGGIDHTSPFPGDNGIMFEPK